MSHSSGMVQKVPTVMSRRSSMRFRMVYSSSPSLISPGFAQTPSSRKAAIGFPMSAPTGQSDSSIVALPSQKLALCTSSIAETAAMYSSLRSGSKPSQ